MDTSFNFYEFVGYIIPGAVVLALLYWFTIAFLGIPSTSNIGGGLPESILLVVFLAASYFFGQLVQTVGKRLEQWWHLTRWEKLQISFFNPNNRLHTDEYQGNLRNYLQETFKLNPIDSRETEYRLKEIFHLCHALIRQENLEANIDKLEAICNFFRGLCAAGLFSAVICILIFLKQLLWLLILLSSGSTLSSDTFFAFSKSQLLMGGLLSLIFSSSIFWLKSRWDQYVGYYVDSVYTSIYVWYQNQNKKSDEKKQEKEGGVSVQ